MNLTVSDEYMLEEYRQIMKAYNNSHERRYSLLKLYLTLVTLPSSLVALLVNFAPIVNLSVSLFDATIFFFIVSFAAGFLIFNSLISIRITQVEYAKAINAIRSYFLKKDAPQIKESIVLPVNPDKPRYYVVGSHFYDCMLIAVLESILVSVIGYLKSNANLHIIIGSFALSLFSQWIFYFYRLHSKDVEWEERKTRNKNQ